MFRGTGVDVDDSVAVFETGQVNADKLLKRYSEAARYDLRPDKMMENFLVFADRLAAKDLVSTVFLEKIRSG